MKFILKINGTESKDAEFVGWTPVKCTLTVDGHTGGSMPVTITTGHLPNKPGRIDLYKDNATSAQPEQSIQHNLQTNSELTFYVAGQFGNPSVAEKDTFILIQSDNSDLTLKKNIMVRVRKNANELSTEEIRLFLESFVRLNNQETREEYSGRYTKMPTKLLHEIILMHTLDAAQEIHGRESFHPWHRAYLMHLERELQILDPRVTVPYWKFDEKAENVFTEYFVGKTKKSQLPDDAPYDDIINDQHMPDFDLMNPLHTYKDNTVWGPLIRAYREIDPAVDKPYAAIRDQIEVISYTDEFIEWCTFEETQSHNPAHSAFSGRVVDIGKDPVDPLFFMMHGNVDRLWAMWQYAYKRFDPDQPKTYPLPYAYEGPRGEDWSEENPKKFNLRSGYFQVGRYDLGNFAEDELWPWGMYREKEQDEANDEQKDAVDRLSRPWRKWADANYGAGVVPELFLKFPESKTSSYPQGPPKVKDTIDYQGRIDQKSSLGFDYDDIPYFDKDPTPKIIIEKIEREPFNAAFLNTDLSIEQRIAAGKKAYLFTEEEQNAAIAIVTNKDENLGLQLQAVQLLDEKTVTFLDTALIIIEDTDKVYQLDLRSDLIHKMLLAKRSNRRYASRRSRFFNILRGLLKSEHSTLRYQALDILSAHDDAETEELLLKQVNSELEGIENTEQVISTSDALFLLRNNPKNQYTKLFQKLVSDSDNTSVRKAALAGLNNDLGSKELLLNVVKNKQESFKIREAGALALHHLDAKTMNNVALEIVTQPEEGDGINMFTKAVPDADEVDFKAGLLNMLHYTGDVKSLKENNALKNSLNELINSDSQNKANFRSTLESISGFRTESDGKTIIEEMAKELLTRIEGNGDQ